MKKTMTFAALHFSTAFTLAYLLTGSIIIGGTLALIEPTVNTVAFYFHDKVWRNIENKKMLAASNNTALKDLLA